MLTIDTILRRTGVALGALGAIVLILGGLTSHGTANIFSYIGAALGAVAWLLACVVAVWSRALAWLPLLVLVAVSGPIVTVAASNAMFGFIPQEANDLAMLALPLTLIGLVGAASKSSGIISRGVIMALSALSVAAIMLGGGLASGGGATLATDLGVVHMGNHLYFTAASLGFFAWLFSLADGVRVRAWGWVIATLLLFNVGALMFGLFAPTRQDVIQARLQRQHRREAGIA